MVTKMSQTLELSDDGVLHRPNGEDDFDIDENYIPANYVEDSVRHIIVRDLDTDIRYFYDRETGSMSECEVF